MSLRVSTQMDALEEDCDNALKNVDSRRESDRRQKVDWTDENTAPNGYFGFILHSPSDCEEDKEEAEDCDIDEDDHRAMPNEEQSDQQTDQEPSIDSHKAGLIQLIWGTAPTLPPECVSVVPTVPPLLQCPPEFAF